MSLLSSNPFGSYYYHESVWLLEKFRISRTTFPLFNHFYLTVSLTRPIFTAFLPTFYQLADILVIHTDMLGLFVERETHAFFIHIHTLVDETNY